MLQARYFLSLQRRRIQAPDHALIAFAGFGRWIIFRIAPSRRYIVQLAVAAKGQSAAVVSVHVHWEAGVACLCRRPKIFDARPISFVWPDAHQPRIRTPS